MNNKDYFSFSQTHDDEIVDITKQEGVLVISKNTTLPDTALMRANHDLILHILK